MRISPKQQRVLRNATHRWNILSGATRSGKTYVSYLLVPLRLQRHWMDNILFCGKTLSTLERNVLDPMRALFGDRMVGAMRADASGARMVEIMGKRCYCVGANDDRAITKIQGMGLGYAYCDELTTYPANFFQMLKSRLDLPDSMCDATCNPEGPGHYVKAFIDSRAAGVDIYNEQFTIYDNIFLSPQFVRNLEAEYRGTIYFDRWILGNWVQTDGLVYPLFRREKHFLTPEQYAAKFGAPRIDCVIFGADGANTNDATAIEPVAITTTGQAVTLRPFYHDPKTSGARSNEQLVPMIQRYLSDLDAEYHLTATGCKYYTTVDCAAADLVLTLSYHLPPRYNVTKYTKKDISATTQTVNSALSRGAVYILDYGGTYNYARNCFEPGTRQLVTDLERMVWASDNRTFDGSIPNDSADAWRYAVCAWYQNPYNLWDTPYNTDYYGGISNGHTGA